MSGKPKYNWKEIDPLLGTCYDSVICKKFGIKSNTAVLLRRKKLGIKAFGAKYHNPTAINWKKIDMYLGKDTDKNVAKWFGMEKRFEAFRKRRQLLNLPSFCNTKSKKNQVRLEKISHQEVLDSLLYNGTTVDDIFNWITEKLNSKK